MSQKKTAFGKWLIEMAKSKNLRMGMLAAASNTNPAVIWQLTVGMGATQAKPLTRIANLWLLPAEELIEAFRSDDVSVLEKYLSTPLKADPPSEIAELVCKISWMILTMDTRDLNDLLNALGEPQGLSKLRENEVARQLAVSARESYRQESLSPLMQEERAHLLARIHTLDTEILLLLLVFMYGSDRRELATLATTKTEG